MSDESPPGRPQEPGERTAASAEGLEGAAPIPREADADRRSTQRERLLRAMGEITSEQGYAAATIAKAISRAGVSRPTFYEYFGDKDDCVVASSQDVGERLSTLISEAAGAGSGELALHRALGALAQFSATEPGPARFLFTEMLAGGPRTLAERDRLIAQLAQSIDAACEGLPESTVAPDLSSRIVIGAVCRMLSTRLRPDEPDLAGLSDGLAAWIDMYAVPLGEHRWRLLAPSSALPLPLLSLVDSPLRAPPALIPGRPKMSRAEVRENHRRRIRAATAEVAKSKGYTAATIADITRLAGVDVRAFNSVFSSKRDAFLATHELGVQSTMAVTAGAFIAAASWPERVWEAGRAFTSFLEANPLIAHVGFVEAYAVGGDAVKRMEDTRVGFTIFLQEGFQAYPQEPAPSAVALEAIATAIFELSYRLTREEVQHGMAGLLANMVHLALTPFMGAVEANKFIEEKLEEAASEDNVL